MRRTLFFNGSAITLSKQGICEALVTEGGQIIGVGYYCDMVRLAGPFAKKADLKGRSLMPFLVNAIEYNNHALSPAFALRNLKTDKTLEIGKPADMIILSCDIMNAHKLSQNKIVADAIIKNGELVHRIDS